MIRIHKQRNRDIPIHNIQTGGRQKNKQTDAALWQTNIATRTQRQGEIIKYFKLDN